MGNKAKGKPVKGGSGGRPAGRPKKKSIKSKAIDMNSKRRIAKQGQRRRKGHEGVAVQYITRSRAVKKLQVTLRDFRRLCILKGIYPREPPNRNFQRAVYHKKDIAFLAHEPLLQRFADVKAHMKKVDRLANRKEFGEAKRRFEQLPPERLDHLVRERYPRFEDALADLDDALCLVHLFAHMHAGGPVSAERTARCARLAKHWQLWVTHARALRRSFLSVKGVYFQAEVRGVPVTWVVPHRFSQNVPKEVDLRVMASFLDFYEVMLSFVLFKLYQTQGLRYPPATDAAADARGAHLAAVRAEALADAGQADKEKEPEASSDKTKKQSKKDKKKSSADKEDDERVASLSTRMRDIVRDQDNDEEEEGVVVEENDGEEADEGELDAAFEGDEEAQRVRQQQRQIAAQTSLFKGLVFWLSREVPLEPLELVIRSFGGEALSAESGASENDPRITHVVADRPGAAARAKEEAGRREWVQPQWVVDSSNFRLRMPVQRYAPGVEMPPHLSPFEDDAANGYTPAFAEEVAKMQAAAGVDRAALVPPSLRADATRRQLPSSADAAAGAADGDNESEGSAEADAREEAFVEELKAELERRSDDEDEEGEEQKKQEQKQQRSKRTRQTSAVQAAEPSKKRARNAVELSETEAAVTANDDEEEQVGSSDEEKASSSDAEEAPVVTFEPSKRFKGARPNCVFRMGPQGLGYYPDENKARPVTYRAGAARSKRQERLAQQREEHEMAQSMMSRKAKRLYDNMQRGIGRRRSRVDELQRRRKSHEKKH